jgi:hypothetical protein
VNSNLALIVCSLFMLGTAAVFGRLRWSRIDVVDLHVLMVSVYFGSYTLVDALVNDLSTVNSGPAVLALLLVMVTVGATWLISRILPIKLRRTLQLRYLLAQWLNVDGRVVLLLLGAVLVFQLYSLQHFGILPESTISVSNTLYSPVSDLPYWFTSAMSFLTPLTFCLFIAVTLKVLASRAGKRVFWIIVLVTVVTLVTVWGRREVFYLMFMFFVLWSLTKTRNLISPMNGFLLLLALPLLVAFSNIFLTYRSNTLAKLGVSGISSATNLDATLGNLQDRMSIWQLNYMIIDKQIHYYGLDIPYGDLLWQGLKNTIPSILWPGKIVSDLDTLMAYQYVLPVTDYPTNNFAMMQADFGYLSVILLPLQLLFVFFSAALLIQASSRHLTLLWLWSGYFIYYLLRIEVDYSAWFTLYRDLLTVTVVYLAAYWLFRPLSRVRLHKRRRFVVHGQAVETRR